MGHGRKFGSHKSAGQPCSRAWFIFTKISGFGCVRKGAEDRRIPAGCILRSCCNAKDNRMTARCMHPSSCPWGPGASGSRNALTSAAGLFGAANPLLVHVLGGLKHGTAAALSPVWVINSLLTPKTCAYGKWGICFHDCIPSRRAAFSGGHSPCCVRMSQAMLLPIACPPLGVCAEEEGGR